MSDGLPRFKSDKGMWGYIDGDYQVAIDLGDREIVHMIGSNNAFINGEEI